MDLHTDRCTLRPFRPADAASVARNANNRKVWLNLRDLFPHPYTVADAEAYIARVADEAPVTRFAIDVAGEAAGSVSGRAISARARCGGARSRTARCSTSTSTPPSARDGQRRCRTETPACPVARACTTSPDAVT